MLSMADVQTLKLTRTSLVVLSECNSFLGQLCTDGVVGITRAFVAAGAQTLLSSLWTVDDRATKILMKRFYRKLVDDAAGDPVLALQQAMQSMILEGFPAKQWASFLVYGSASKLNIETHQPKSSNPLERHLMDFIATHLTLTEPALQECLKLAVSWCQQNGLDHIRQVKELGKASEFVAALQLKPVKARILEKNIENVPADIVDELCTKLRQLSLGPTAKRGRFEKSDFETHLSS